MNSDKIYEYIQALENKTKALLEQQNVLISLICANDRDKKRVYIDLDESGNYGLVVTDIYTEEEAVFGESKSRFGAVLAGVKEYIEWENNCDSDML